MPLERCSKNGKTGGWRWGSKGACYFGPKAKVKALKQGYAENPKHFEQVMKNAKASEYKDMCEVIKDILTNDDLSTSEYRSLARLIGHTESDNLLEAAEAYITKKERDKISKEDYGDPEDEKYPARNRDELLAALRYLHKAPKEKQASIKARLKKIAKRHGWDVPSFEEKKDKE